MNIGSFHVCAGLVVSPNMLVAQVDIIYTGIIILYLVLPILTHSDPTSVAEVAID